MATATWLYVSLLFSFYGFVVAVAAERFVDVGLSEDHKLVTLGKSVGVVCRASASYAYCVNLLDVFSDCHERRHRTERLAEEVCIETGDDHSYPAICESLYDFYDRIIKELSLVNTYDFHIGCYLQHACRRADGC